MRKETFCNNDVDENFEEFAPTIIIELTTSKKQTSVSCFESSYPMNFFSDMYLPIIQSSMTSVVDQFFCVDTYAKLDRFFVLKWPGSKEILMLFFEMGESGADKNWSFQISSSS